MAITDDLLGCRRAVSRIMRGRSDGLKRSQVFDLVMIRPDQCCRCRYALFKQPRFYASSIE